MTVEELVLLIDLLDKLGYNTEVGGTGTVFQRLAQIADYVDTLETKVGLNSDVAGTTTLFARLAQIAGYTDQVEGFVDTLETAVTDLQASRVGSTADAANATGSANAKLAYLINNLGQKARGLVGGIGSFSTSLQTLQTALNISGKGRLVGLMSSQTNGTTLLTIKVTIDNNVFIWGNAAQNTSPQYPAASLHYTTAQDGSQYVFNNNASSVVHPWVAEIMFKQSLKIEISTTSASNTGTIYWLYESE